MIDNRFVLVVIINKYVDFMIGNIEEYINSLLLIVILYFKVFY